MDLSSFTIVIPSLLLRPVSHVAVLAEKTGISVQIVLPRDFNGPLQYTDQLNYLFSDKTGQVSQRIFGIKRVNSENIICMDDDIEVDEDQLHKMCDIFTRLTKSGQEPVLGAAVVAPGDCRKAILSTLSPISYKIISIIEGEKISSLRRPSYMSKLFFVTSHDADFFDTEVSHLGCYSASWISGGFFIARTESLPKREYVQKKGKAFAEDLVLSWYLRNRGCNLFIASGVSLNTAEIASSLSLPNLSSKLYMLRFCRLRLKYFRFWASLLVRLCSYAVNK